MLETIYILKFQFLFYKQKKLFIFLITISEMERNWLYSCIQSQTIYLINIYLYCNDKDVT